MSEQRLSDVDRERIVSQIAEQIRWHITVAVIAIVLGVNMVSCGIGIGTNRKIEELRQSIETPAEAGQ